MTKDSKAPSIELIILGCGASSGVPVPTCQCAVCQSANPKNQRNRTAAWIRTQSLSLLIDTGPDFRAQALRENIQKIDAVLYTHAHADHLNGIDDLRIFCVVQQRPIPIYADANTLQTIQERFHYVLSPKTAYWDKLTVEPHLIKAGTPFLIGNTSITPIPLQHGGQTALGWRIGDVAWLTDVSDIPDASLPLLKDLKLLCLDCLRPKPYPAHLTIEQAFDWSQRINASQTVLIHMGHEIDYDELLSHCPPRVTVGYDGMRFASD